MASRFTDALGNPINLSGGGQAYMALFGEEGASEGVAVTAKFRVWPAGTEPPPFVLTNGLDLTLSIMRASPLVTTSSGNVTINLPTFNQLGYTRAPGTSAELSFIVQRQFVGQLIVNPKVYWGVTTNQSASPAAGSMLSLSSAQIGDWTQRSDSGMQQYRLTALPASTLGNWLAISLADATRPNIAWGAVANQAAMVALSNAIVGDTCTRTDAGGALYQLIAAPFSTPGNWITRADAQAPSTPGIIVHTNGLDPASTTVYGGQPVKYSTMGIGNDEWFVS